MLVDKRPDFLMGLRKLWALVGLGTLEGGSRARATLKGEGIRFVEEEIHAIDPEGRAAQTDSGRIAADRLVVALGAEPRPDLVPGLVEHGHNVWDPGGVAGRDEDEEAATEGEEEGAAGDSDESDESQAAPEDASATEETVETEESGETEEPEETPEETPETEADVDSVPEE